VSDSLYDALVQTRLRLERGIDDAQHELRDARDRCATLVGVIRSLRNQLWDAARPEPAVEPTALVVVPEAVAEAPVPPDADEVQEPQPVVEVAEADEEEESGSLEVPTTYMPILEELWDIARRADSH
jgi:hypothetical protein